MKRPTTRKQPQKPTPPPSKPALSTTDSPAINFDFNRFDDVTPKPNRGGAPKLMKKTTGLLSPSPVQKSAKNLSSIADLKDLAASNVESVKRHLDRSHSEILKDVDASQCRLQKRYKMQSQACQEIMDEAEKEYKKMSGRIDKGRDAMKDSYAAFISEAQASASRLCKASIPELSQTVEKSIASLRSRYGISSTANI